MATHSDEDQENTKNSRLKGLSKSDQKDIRSRKDPRHFAKIATAGPSPMSFGNMIDELMDSGDSENCDQLGAPSRQMLFVPIENQMAGD